MRYAALGVLMALAGVAAPSPQADRLVVAADGSGDFRRVQEAVDFVREGALTPVTILIRRGRYEELVRVPRAKPNLRLIGEDRKEVVIAALNNDKLNPGVSRRCVVGVEAADTVIENLTIRNLTPYKGSQAEALTVKADRCVLRHVDFLSFQDTLNLNGRTYVEDCYVEGDVDFVWGRGPAVFDRCHLRMMHDGCVVQSRNEPDKPGFVFLDCRLTAAPEVKKFVLARIDAAKYPASQVSFVRCAMPGNICRQAWQLDGGAASALRFEEHATTDEEGRPADLSARRHGRLLDAKQATELTPDKVLAGSDGWKAR